MEYEVKLKETLSAMGMEEAFGNQADFSRMIEGITGGIAINEVTHKTFVDVNEEGTEAAAVTSIDVILTSLPPSIRVDKPFIFLIREKSSNTILFIGKLENPM
jgi:serpin B